MLAGSGDTLCVASLTQQDGWGVNYTLNQGQTWWGSYLGCNPGDVWGVSFGARTVAAILNAPDQGHGDKQASSIWHTSFEGNKTGVTAIKWPDSVLADTALATSANNAVYAEGKFYLACQNGGLVRWNPQSGELRGVWPGSSVSFDPAAVSHGSPSFTAKNANVFAADIYKSSTGTKILALTEPRLWLFNPADSSWDSSITAALADPTLTFGRFAGTVVNNAVSPPIVYAYIDKKEPGVDTLTLSLFRYHWGQKTWSRVLKTAPSVATGAPRGFLYGVGGKNAISAYRDSVGDSAAAPAGDLAEVISDQKMYDRLTVNKGMDKPESINDMLFIPLNDSTGHFWIASSNGLFLSNREIPGDTSEFTLLHRDRAVQGGLKETYAQPGIINDDYRNSGASKTTFVYKLGSDAKVTIRVFDFSMQLVKTIIDNAPRKAANALGRSTSDKDDVWDATTGTGKPVAPGLYYYKITTSTGERSFGKIVVAKGKS